MNPSEIKKVLAEIGGGANKRLGQHFLIDRSALATIVEAAMIKPGDRVLEVGPGLGVLTGALIEKGAEVTAIEQDRRFIDFLQKRYPNHLAISHGDAATLAWDGFVGDGPWKFVSNLPYSITSLALRKALWPVHRSFSEGGPSKPPEILVVLVQREVAERAVAIAPSPSSSPSGRGRAKTSLLSLMVAFASSSSKIVKRVPAGAFFPPPKVESAILQIVPMSLKERAEKWGMDPEKVMAFAKRGFAHPRKFLASNLGLDAEQKKRLVEAGIAEKARAEDLSPEMWAKLAATFSEK